MKAVINEKETKSRYPYLGIREDDQDYTVILFTAKNTGTCVSSNAELSEIGEYATDWGEFKFTPFTGSITLSND